MLESVQKITPPELAERWGISADKVLGWIKAGELRAVNAATKRDRRPRWIIDAKDLAAFEASRSSTAKHEATPRQQRRKTLAAVKEFF